MDISYLLCETSSNRRENDNVLCKRKKGKNQKERCIHGKQIYRCRECGNGKAFCKHNKRKETCIVCVGSQICIHFRRKETCKECRGKGICEHNRRKETCRECGGKAFCEHDKRKEICKECKRKKR